MSKVSKEVQNAFVDLLENIDLDGTLLNNSAIVVAKALGFTDEEIKENLMLESIADEEEEDIDIDYSDA